MIIKIKIQSYIAEQLNIFITLVDNTTIINIESVRKNKNFKVMNLLESIKKSFTSSPKQDIKNSSSVVPREKSLGAVHGDEIQSAFFTGDNQALLNQSNFSFLIILYKSSESASLVT